MLEVLEQSSQAAGLGFTLTSTNSTMVGFRVPRWSRCSRCSRCPRYSRCSRKVPRRTLGASRHLGQLGASDH